MIRKRGTNRIAVWIYNLYGDIMITKYEDKYIKMGLKIQYYRKLKGYTQEVFAEMIGKSWSFVAQIESPANICGISLETLFKIAEVLDVEPYRILKND